MFLLGAVVLVLAFVIVWFLPEEKLRTQSGIDARQQEAAAAAALGEGAAGEAVLEPTFAADGYAGVPRTRREARAQWEAAARSQAGTRRQARARRQAHTRK